jgi:hypothetical protein
MGAAYLSEYIRLPPTVSECDASQCIQRRVNGILERLGSPVRLCTRVRTFAKYTCRKKSVAVHGAAVVAVEATSVEVVILILVGPSSSGSSSDSTSTTTSSSSRVVLVLPLLLVGGGVSSSSGAYE